MAKLSGWIDDLRQWVKKEVLKELRNPSKGLHPIVRMGTIDPSYEGAGRPRVQFDGDDSESVRRFAYLASYAPTAGDRVLLLRAGSSWVIVGRVE